MSEKQLIINKELADFLKRLTGISAISISYQNFLAKKHIDDSLQSRAKFVLTEHQQGTWNTSNSEFIESNKFVLTALAKWTGEVKVIHLQLDYYSIGLSSEVKLEETRYMKL